MKIVKPELIGRFISLLIGEVSISIDLLTNEPPTSDMLFCTNFDITANVDGVPGNYTFRIYGSRVPLPQKSPNDTPVYLADAVKASVFLTAELHTLFVSPYVELPKETDNIIFKYIVRIMYEYNKLIYKHKRTSTIEMTRKLVVRSYRAVLVFLGLRERRSKRTSSKFYK